MDADRHRRARPRVSRSHGHGQLVVDLLQDIQSLCEHSILSGIVTVNIPERLPFAPDWLQ